ncbi:hypothetical protein HA052_19705 [Chromobacterium haemolyticum]|uniref:Uncharacterized protein n=1 Tax=Chromobacterium fluminis TaxID=3044269 RepID=A0ABX0L6U3_9NEIS|nr:hypothetical protein [Chromobacterium haemolyticum]NHR07420.1 hypothetical protein [Chromobacterium haemolyticum]
MKLEQAQRAILIEAKRYGGIDAINLEAIKAQESTCTELERAGLLRRDDYRPGRATWSLTYMGHQALLN